MITEPNYDKVGADIKATFDLIKRKASERIFESTDELNEFLSQFRHEINNTVKIDFLGLSPTQMANILHVPFRPDNAIFQLQEVDKESLEKIPIVASSLYFLNKLNTEDIKASQLGNLPRDFVRELYDKFFSKETYSFVPHKEDDSQQISSLRRILTVAGLIKLKSKKFSLTEKGRTVLHNGDYNILFKELFTAFANKFNWGYGDRYPDFALIQSSCIFNIYMLHKKAQEWTDEKILGDLYVRAFPALKRECEIAYWEPEQEISNCFRVRFLERFCLPLGLIEEKPEGEKLERTVFYRITPVFRMLFKFSIRKPDKTKATATG